MHYGIRERVSYLSPKHTAAHNGGKYMSAQAPLKGNKAVEVTGMSYCKHIHTQGTGRHSLAPIPSHEIGKTPSPHSLNHLQCPHQQQSPLPSASTRAANDQRTQPGMPSGWKGESTWHLYVSWIRRISRLRGCFK